MNTHFSLKSSEAYLWQLFLPDFSSQLTELSSLLSPDEIARAERFHFAIHRERFILGRGILRMLLSRYTQIAPDKIQFQYGPQGKPYLPGQAIQFNASHSHDYGIIAFCLEKEIGVDIEKIEPEFKEGVAKRFFSPDEYNYLLSLPDSERIQQFYAVWTRKEAFIKAQGEGLYKPLHLFSVLNKEVSIHDSLYQLDNFSIDDQYACAYAITADIQNIIVKRLEAL